MVMMTSKGGKHEGGGAPEDNSIRGEGSHTLLRIDRLFRVKQWLKTQRHVDEELWGKRFAEDVAIIIGRTYAERGDAAIIADDVALMMIRDLLLDADEGIIKRNKMKRLPRAKKA